MLFDRAALNRLYRYAYTLCGQEAAAYDLVQDGVERCLRVGPDPLRCPEGYARRVIRNRYIDLIRRDRAGPEMAAVDDVELLAIDTQCLEEMLISQNELARVWSLLDPFEREILYYWAVEEMSAAQIAVTLNSRRGTVLSRIHRLRARLRSALADEPGVTEGRAP